MPIVEVPGMGDVEFPDDMSDDQIAAAIKANLQPQAKAPTPDPSLYNTGDELGKLALRGLRSGTRAVGLAGRTIMNTAAGIPLLAADTGILARNKLTGSDYEGATSMYNRALDDAGVPQFETTIEKAGDVAGQMLLGSKLPAPQALNNVPASFNPQSMRALALKKAQDAGYVVPPSSTNPTVLNRFLESWGGKIATAQDASFKNQSITDKLVKADLGLKASDDVAEGTLPFLRQEAANTGYKPIRGVGAIRLDSQYSQALDDIAAPYIKAQSAFPGLSKTDIADTVEALKQKSVDTDTAVDSIAILREKADAAFRQGEGGLGKAYKGMAKALEEATERSLTRRGSAAKELLEEFRAARKLIAQTHSAEKALNPELGSFDARKLAAQLNAGKPLSGGMKKAGQAAQAFKEATKLSTDSGSVSNLDMAFGGAAAVGSGNPAPLLYPFSRMAVRDLLLSPTGQRLAVPSNSYGLPPGLLMGGATGLTGP